MSLSGRASTPPRRHRHHDNHDSVDGDIRQQRSQRRGGLGLHYEELGRQHLQLQIRVRRRHPPSRPSPPPTPAHQQLHSISTSQHNNNNSTFTATTTSAFFFKAWHEARHSMKKVMCRHQGSTVNAIIVSNDNQEEERRRGQLTCNTKGPRNQKLNQLHRPKTMNTLSDVQWIQVERGDS